MDTYARPSGFHVKVGPMITHTVHSQNWYELVIVGQGLNTSIHSALIRNRNQRLEFLAEAGT